MVKFNSVADVNNYVGQFQTTKNQMLGASNGFMVKGREELYNMLGEAKSVCDALLDAANVDYLAAALLERQIRPAIGSTLVYTPLIKMLFGAFDHNAPKVTFEGKAGLTAFVVDRSAEKYASVMFWFEHHKITSGFADALETVEGKMDGAIKEVRGLRNSKPVENQAVVEERIDLLLEYSTEVMFSSDEIKLDEKQGRFGALWFENVEGQIVIRGLLPTKSDIIAKHVSAVAKEREPDLKAAKANEERKAAKNGNSRSGGRSATAKGTPAALNSLRQQVEQRGSEAQG